MTRAYLAARYSRREEMLGHLPALGMVGLTVRSTWLHGSHESDASAIALDPDLLGTLAAEDFREVVAASVFITFTEGPEVGFTSGGRHVEMGIALAASLRCIVIGPRENVFHHLSAVEVHPTLEAFLEAERRRIA